ncbi:hypothetical protein ACRRTK_008964 [Alexandromys fortis]
MHTRTHMLTHAPTGQSDLGNSSTEILFPDNRRLCQTGIKTDHDSKTHTPTHTHKMTVLYLLSSDQQQREGPHHLKQPPLF